MKKFSEKINENKVFRDHTEYLIQKKAYQDEKGYWHCDKDLSIPERYQHLFIKNGKLICKFGVIKGKFMFRAQQAIKNNTNSDILTSLEGMPYEVHKRFTVAHQKGINSAVGMPRKVGGDIEFRNCKLTSLEGFPATCEDLILPGNQFKDLTGLTCSPRKSIDASYGRLTSLEGIPQEITCERFIAHENGQLSSLKGLEKIKAKHYSFGFNNNTKLPDWLSDFFWHVYKDEYPTSVHMSLLKYMMRNKLQREIDKIDWPEGFLNDNLKKSAQAIGKFNI